MADPAIDALFDRIAALEGAPLNTTIAVLQRKLEQNWNPDAGSVLTPGSIDIGLLDGALKFGIDTLTWAGGTPRSGNASVLHGLGRTPNGVWFAPTSSVAGSSTVFPVMVERVSARTTLAFEATAVTSDESNPAAASVSTFAWLVL